MDLPNLRYLDLSSNQIPAVNIDVFSRLKNLKDLSLADNPLRQLYHEDFSKQRTSLESLDLSQTEFLSFDSSTLSPFVALQRLNLSFSSLHSIDKNGFQDLPSLTHLDLRGCKVREFPDTVFHGLIKLRRVEADTYKLCCRQILPPSFDENFWVAP
jgi:Leucine-rich repeat (LRR) protein